MVDSSIAAANLGFFNSGLYSRRDEALISRTGSDDCSISLLSELSSSPKLNRSKSAIPIKSLADIVLLYREKLVEDYLSRRERESVKGKNNMILTILSSGEQGLAEDSEGAARKGDQMLVNPYEVLQVRKDATPSEIRHAYRRLALLHHPGRRCGGTTSAIERTRRLYVFELLAASYETLLDKETRLRCDALLRDQYADMRRPRSIPAGKVNVGGKPLPLESGLENNPNTFVARVISRLAAVRRADSGDLHDASSTGHMPHLEPVSSSESSLAPDQNPDDTSECSLGGGSNFLEKTSGNNSSPIPVSVTSPRIHMPLGTPLGSPTREAGSNCSSPVRHNLRSHASKSQEGFLACGMNTLNSFESHGHAIPALMSSSTAETPKGERHYTEGETNRLFGGPLQLLFRARRWKPFRDPLDVFAEVFGSRVPLGSTQEPLEAKAKSSPLEMIGDSLLPPQSSSAGWSGTSETLSDGTIVFRTIRIVQNRRMIRTETVHNDPDTGIKHSQVTVTSELLNDPDEHNGTVEGEDDENASSWYMCGNVDCCYDQLSPSGLFCGWT